MISYRLKLALGLALTVALLLAAYFLHYRDKWAVSAYQRQLVAAGEKLKIEQLWRVPPLPESNGAPLFSQIIWGWNSATNLLDKNPPLAMHIVAPGKAIWMAPGGYLVCTNQYLGRGGSGACSIQCNSRPCPRSRRAPCF